MPGAALVLQGWPAAQRRSRWQLRWPEGPSSGRILQPGMRALSPAHRRPSALEPAALLPRCGCILTQQAALRACARDMEHHLTHTRTTQQSSTHQRLQHARLAAALAAHHRNLGQVELQVGGQLRAAKRRNAGKGGAGGALPGQRAGWSAPAACFREAARRRRTWLKMSCSLLMAGMMAWPSVSDCWLTESSILAGRPSRSGCHNLPQPASCKLLLQPPPAPQQKARSYQSPKPLSVSNLAGMWPCLGIAAVTLAPLELTVGLGESDGVPWP